MGNLNSIGHWSMSMDETRWSDPEYISMVSLMQGELNEAGFPNWDMDFCDLPRFDIAWLCMTCHFWLVACTTWCHSRFEVYRRPVFCQPVYLIMSLNHLRKVVEKDLRDSTTVQKAQKSQAQTSEPRQRQMVSSEIDRYTTHGHIRDFNLSLAKQVAYLKTKKTCTKTCPIVNQYCWTDCPKN